MEKRLYRSTTDRHIAGVCGGLGEYFNVDPSIFRIIFVLLFLGGSAGFWIYLILSLVLPNDYEVRRNKANPFETFTKKTQSHGRKDVTPEKEPNESDWSDF
ncbi:PspC domain-containing protein [Aerococcaceae bacterium DSM 111020]|nr:PspC domain-containing protein [Aerococcaceae bacterium DSM 111020]